MNSIASGLRIALGALKTNKIRTALTMLGVIIGVAAVIATVAVGSGATVRIQQQIAGLGSNMIMVAPGSITTSGIRLGSGNAVTLTEDDARAIAAQCGEVSRAAPVVRQASQVIGGNNNWATSILGVTPEYLTIRDLEVERGSGIMSRDIETTARIVLLGPTVAENLFGTSDPMGQLIRIRNVSLTVAGILAVGVSQANAGSVTAIMLQAAGADANDSAQERVRSLLRQRHRLQAAQEDDFTTIRNPEEVFAAQETFLLA